MLKIACKTILMWENKNCLFRHFKKLVIDYECSIYVLSTFVGFGREKFQLMTLSRIDKLWTLLEVEVGDTIHQVESVFWDATSEYFT